MNGKEGEKIDIEFKREINEKKSATG